MNSLPFYVEMSCVIEVWKGNVTWSFHQGVLTQIQTLLEVRSKVFKRSEREILCLIVCGVNMNSRVDGFAYDLVLV
jgi:hypothetical protein